ncbi:MAG: ComF family protein [Actinomycetia bacterium]|nr:ComF family protein [Actinomycetes bacterium]
MLGVLHAFAEIVSPVCCAGCGLPGSALCARCRAGARLITQGDACPRCGAAVEASTCTECGGRDFAFSAAACAGRLEPPLSRAITLYKDAAERRYASLLGSLLLDACERWRGWPDAVCAIPPTRAARVRRGFDHTEALAHAVAAGLKVPSAGLLDAARRPDQRRLGRDARFANMAEAFTVRRDAQVPGHVLVVDDVLTTGATFDGAARALLAAGAIEVRVAAVARA